MQTYSEFFRQVTGHQPLPYQRRLNESPAEFTAVSIATGLGKTEGVLVDWLYRQPTRRLAWCLPGRALTGQVVKVARGCAARLGVKVLELMGGSADNDLTLAPDERAILVGTQDILVSRALNRGYARSPFRWPIDFALLNNDTQWVFDEVQLLGDSLATSTQLAGLRDRLRTFGHVPCIWMSATLDKRWLRTPDFVGLPIRDVTLDDEDLKHEIVRRRLNAPKALAPAPQECRLPKGCAAFVRREHREGSLTLVICNTVERAREICADLADLDPVLLHSRFRPNDRQAQLERVMTGGAGVVVSTQVIEAGIDLDADLLVTDAAPWPSLVQRFGRVNRKGEKDASRIYWVDRPLPAKRKNWAAAETLKDKDAETAATPYELGEVRDAIDRLSRLKSAAPADLPPVSGPEPYHFVLRRSDLMDLVDTTPDLAGNQIDVSRFVRSGKDTDVYVAWREWPAGEKPPVKPRIGDQELCPLPLGTELKEFIKKNEGWVWRPLRDTGKFGWERVDEGEMYPGMRLLVRSGAGGYEAQTGWRPDLVAWVEPAKTDSREPAEEDHDSDRYSAGPRRTLAEHTDGVVDCVCALLHSLEGFGLEPFAEELAVAARRHDWGKAHPVFQETLYGLAATPVEPPGELLAKSDPGVANKHHRWPWFRHELASALAILSSGGTDLQAYLAAAHHGKVRMSIRSMPDEAQAGRTRGIHKRDTLFAADLGAGCAMPATVLSLEAAEMGLGGDGARSWSDRILALLEEHGPFCLAYLEMLLRAADERASAAQGVVTEESR